MESLEGHWGQRMMSASERAQNKTWTRTLTSRETWPCSTKPLSSLRSTETAATATGHSITASRVSSSLCPTAMMRIFWRGSPLYTDRSQCPNMGTRSSVLVRYKCMHRHTHTPNTHIQEPSYEFVAAGVTWASIMFWFIKTKFKESKTLSPIWTDLRIQLEPIDCYLIIYKSVSCVHEKCCF